MQGYLELWQGYFSRWSKYYFRLHEQSLLFGPTKEEIECRVHLQIAQIITNFDDPISLIIHTGTEVVYLRAYSIDERVKWFKKLKEVQKQITSSRQSKELSKVRIELNRKNRVKILEDLNTQLWKCHAQLERKLQQVVSKTRNVMISKNIDKLRITVDEFKFKTSQMLQIIQEEVRQIKNKGQGFNSETFSFKKSPNHYDQVEEAMILGNRRNDQTHFYSFSADKPTNFSPVKTYKLSEINEESILQDFQNQLNKKKSIISGQSQVLKKRTSNMSQHLSEGNRIKMKLFNQNKVYVKIGKDFPNEASRKSLPQKFTPEQKFPIFGTFSSALGSGADITKITLPVTTNEPLSTLQKGCEQMYYSQLLKKADGEDNEVNRILYVSAFVVSIYSLNQGRVKKPFNPLLGETFQFIDEKREFQFLGEQVSHHPPISAFYIRSDNYQIYDNTKSKVSFSGNSIKVTPSSSTIIKLEKNSDYYIFNKCIVSLTNILIGKTYVEISGEITIQCKQSQTEAHLNFKEESLFGNNDACRIDGYIMKKNKKQFILQGRWNEDLIATNIRNQQRITLWRKKHQLIREFYNFNEYSLQLNFLNQSLSKSIAPTDSRLRPDQRALEYRYLELAAEQKNRLQEKQRKRKKQNEQNKQQHMVLWFSPSKIQGEQAYVSTERYWDEKIKGNWKDSPDIY